MKMEQTECSEMSAHKIQTPGNYPEENIQHAECYWNCLKYEEMQNMKQIMESVISKVRRFTLHTLKGGFFTIRQQILYFTNLDVKSYYYKT